MQFGSIPSFLVEDLGNIAQQVDGGASSIVSNYLQNTQKSYDYNPVNALEDVVFNKSWAGCAGY